MMWTFNDFVGASYFAVLAFSVLLMVGVLLHAPLVSLLPPRFHAIVHRMKLWVYGRLCSMGIHKVNVTQRCFKVKRSSDTVSCYYEVLYYCEHCKCLTDIANPKREPTSAELKSKCGWRWIPRMFTPGGYIQ